MTEANRDEIEKCLQIAQAAMSNRDAAKALRFLEKAKRMGADDPSLDAAITAAQAMGSATPSAADNAPRPSAASADEGVRHRSSTGSSAGAQAGASGMRTNKQGQTYTTDQSREVQRILRTKDYYDVLGAAKNAGEDEVKRAYKKMALKLHPDKNKAPGAEEAFKKLSKAAQCLTDAEKKRAYDRYGDEDQVPRQQRHHEQEFVSPQDFFAAFFGGGVMPGHAHHHRQHQQQQQQQGGQQGGQPQDPRAQLLQMLPILMLVMLTLASNFAGPETSRFSLTPSGDYKFSRVSAGVGVKFYVSKDFRDSYPDGTRNLAEFEQQVEVYYVRNLHSECDQQEKVMYKKVMIARRRGNKEELEAARNHPRPACKQMESIKKKHPGVYRQAVFNPF